MTHVRRKHRPSRGDTFYVTQYGHWWSFPRERFLAFLAVRATTADAYDLDDQRCGASALKRAPRHGSRLGRTIAPLDFGPEDFAAVLKDITNSGTIVSANAGRLPRSA